MKKDEDGFFIIVIFCIVIVKKYIKRVKNNPLTPFDKGE
jgi:hypothetical protein